MLRYQAERGEGKGILELHGFEWKEKLRRSQTSDIGSNGCIEKIGMQEWFSLPEERLGGCTFPRAERPNGACHATPPLIRARRKEACHMKRCETFHLWSKRG